MTNFHYPLDAVIKRNEWEIDALKGEMATLNQAMHARMAELQSLQDAVRAAEQEIQGICRQHTIIRRDHKAIVETYLGDRRRQTDLKQQEIARAQALIDQVFLQLRSKQQVQRSIKNHRELKQQAFLAEQARRDSLEADALWLAKLAAAH
ncbi:MAG: hypothetical protein V4632_22595 [Pseudomonadota bacterium]